MRFLVNLLIFIVFNVVCVPSERICETKCMGYTRRAVNSTSPSILVQFSRKNRNDFETVGTLVAENFILTTFRSDFRQTHVQASFQPNNIAIDIDEIFIRMVFNGHDVSYGIALLKFNTSSESHRSTCLFPGDELELSSKELKSGNDLVRTLTSENCVEIFGTQATGLATFCLDLINVTVGSPVLTGNQFNYLYGVTTHNINGAEMVIKVYDHLDWIESHIWPELTCGKRQINENAAASTYHGQFPWHAAIFEFNTNRNKVYICGGTVLNELTVLTAAHCISDHRGLKSPALLVVALGIYDIGANTTIGQEIRVSRVIPHRQYRHYRLENDIAILKLRTEIIYSLYIQPICVSPRIDIFPSNIGVLPGWGLRDTNLTLTNLKSTVFPIRTVSECRFSNRHIFSNYLHARNFCAGFRNGTDACTGDSGGGLIFNLEHQSYIRGIVSLGVPLPNRECDPTQYVIFTNVTSFYKWIVYEMRN